jgi:hypothetical protein
MKLPDYITKYLWDVNLKDDSAVTHPEFIIERVLEYGDFKSLKWLEKTYDKDKITEVLKTSNKISTKTGNFYALYFNIPKEELLCIRKPFTQKQNRF